MHKISKKKKMHACTQQQKNLKSIDLNARLSGVAKNDSTRGGISWCHPLS